MSLLLTWILYGPPFVVGDVTTGDVGGRPVPIRGTAPCSPAIRGASTVDWLWPVTMKCEKLHLKQRGD